MLNSVSTATGYSITYCRLAAYLYWYQLQIQFKENLFKNRYNPTNNYTVEAFYNDIQRTYTKSLLNPIVVVSKDMFY